MGLPFAVHSSSFTQAHVRATHHRRDVGAAAGADAGQTPDMPPLRGAHASGLGLGVDVLLIQANVDVLNLIFSGKCRDVT